MRISWDDYFIEIAKMVSKRSTCPRLAVGAVIVKDKRILATGYNGSLAGEPHCEDVGCDMVNGHCQRTVHAETNAIAQAAMFGISVSGAVLYCWLSKESYSVCRTCEKLLTASGISLIVERKGE